MNIYLVVVDGYENGYDIIEIFQSRAPAEERAKIYNREMYGNGRYVDKCLLAYVIEWTMIMNG